MTQRDTYGCDSFHLAIASRNDQLVEFLIDQGQININSVDNELRTPLHYATMFGTLPKGQRRFCDPKTIYSLY